MTAPSSFKFSLQCGAGGTWVEVTDDVLFEEGPINYTDARTSQFDGFSPGTYPLTLNNSTGKYTPNNPATTLAVPLSEGMGVCMELAGALFSGTIRSATLLFPPLESASKARVRITTDDMLGNAARHGIPSIGDQIESAFIRWPLTDAAGSLVALGSGTPSSPPPLVVDTSGGSGSYAFGGGAPIPDATAVLALTAGVTGSPVFTTSGVFPAYPYSSDTLGAWGYWVVMSEASLSFTFNVELPAASTSDLTGVSLSTVLGLARVTMTRAVGLSVSVSGPTLTPGIPYYISTLVTTEVVAGNVLYTAELFVNGISYGTNTLTPSPAVAARTNRAPDSVSFVHSVVGAIGVGATCYISRISHSLAPVNEAFHADSTIADRIAALASTTPEVTLDTLPTLSTAVVGDQDGGFSTLDGLNEVIRAEQGYMWSETTGTLTAPVEKIKIAARDRERAVDYTFDVSEIVDPIPLIHSLTNTVSQATADGPETSATYQDPSLTPLVGSASTSDSVPLRDYIDLYGYASDRLVRGINLGVAITSITIDATSPLINRWSDLTAIRQGYRLSITGLPSSQLGYSTWDGFVVGRQIDNTQDSQTDAPKSFFTFYLSPRTRVPVFDTDVFAAGDVLTLSADINAAVTTMSIATSDPLTKFTTSGLPLDVVMGSERMTVSVVTSATPQVFTMSRGVGGTTAAAHTAGDALEMYDPARFAF